MIAEQLGATDDGQVKLGDFGLAKVMREVAMRKTEIRGTPLCMAPEQITGENIDHRTDLYAVGCTLFELLTSRPPSIEGEILYQQLAAVPPVPSSLNPAISEGLDRLILAMIAKQADDRPPNAAEIRTRIKALLAPGD